MPYINRPNSWVSQDTAGTTQLAYALQLNPAPLTVSIDGRDPLHGSLEFVMTNTTASAISVSEVSFTIQVGTDGSNLTPSTENVVTSVSDRTNWDFSSPGKITSGPADFTLSPKTGSSVSVAAGASIIVEIIGFPTVENPGNTTITVRETTDSTGFTSFLVTTFPSGFYFNSLSATVANGSQLVPVAQVASGSTVTMIWNSSVAELVSFTIYYSDAAQGQQTATPSDIGIWTSPPISADTVFTIVLTVSIADASPLTAALSTSVTVQNPSLVATSLTAGMATVNGPLTVNGATQANDITATGLTVNGSVSAGIITASGPLTVNGATQANDITATGLTVNGPVSAGIITASDSLTVADGKFSGKLTSNIAVIDSGQGMVISCDPQQHAKLMVTNAQPDSSGLHVFSANSQSPYWALTVDGSCSNTSGSWAQFSDPNMIDRVVPYQDSLEQLLQINPIRYRFKEALGLDTTEHFCAAAQNLEKIAPYMLSKGKIKPDSEEEFLTIDNGPLTYMLINAVKELHSEIESLKAELKTLRSK
ncbi:MAG: hypothetical protein WAN35_05335 [Terracidiphilus sp.]